MGERDVTAVVLTIGEPFLRRALDSLERQTQPLADVVQVDGINPFHRAFNAGVARVRSEFFVQVDADMVLDPTAVADLRACIAPGIAVVIGGLRDPLRGSVVGLKLYRTACAAAQPCPDSITPAVDFVTAMRDRGWMTAHALKYRPGPPALWHTFGEHQPDYSPLYTFSKFRILGARYRHWRKGPSLRRLFEVVHASRHPAALVAQVGAASGVFWEEARDALQPCAPSRRYDRLQRLLAAGEALPPLPAPALTGTLADAFLDHRRAGCELARSGDGSGFRRRFAALAGDRRAAAWVALVGLCQGSVEARFDPAAAAAELDSLTELFPNGFGA